MKKLLSFGFIALLSLMTFGCVQTTAITTETTSLVTTLDPTSLAANIPSECQEVAIVGGWVPVWCEEFNYTGTVDSTKWGTVVGGGGFGNNELQYYTNRSQNLSVGDGNLTISAIKENYSGSLYTSAKIWTQGKFDFKYGKFEIRAKVPASGGTWPAFWMMPSDSVYGGWPDSGEIDILEHTGNNLDTVLGTIHTEKYNHILGTQISFSKYLNGLSDDFHTYSVIWNEYSFSWYVDDYKYGTTTFDAGGNTDVLTSAAWPFDQDFYLILNLAMGGGLGGEVDPAFTSDAFMVDYVRVFKRDYVTQDTQSPTMVTGLQAVKAVGSEAYLIWNRASDSNSYTGYGQVQGYNVYLNGNFYRFVSLNTLRLTGLTTGQTYLVEVQTVDYAGNASGKVSLSFQTS